MKIWILSFLLLTSCGDDDFKKVENLTNFRILAIEASAPEVAPGGTSTLRVFVSDPKGPVGGRTISGSTVSCIDPGISLGAPVSCNHDANKVTGTYAIDTTVADLVNNLFTGFSGSLNVTVPATIFTGRSQLDKTNGVGYITIFTFVVDGATYTSFKRIVATDRGVLNSNPTGSAILLNGAALAGNPQKGDRFSMTSSVPETYQFINVDGSSEIKTEELTVAWYITTGEFDRPKSDLSELVKLTTTPPATSYLLIGIVRDGRGGVDVVRSLVP